MSPQICIQDMKSGSEKSMSAMMCVETCSDTSSNFNHKNAHKSSVLKTENTIHPEKLHIIPDMQFSKQVELVHEKLGLTLLGKLKLSVWPIAALEYGLHELLKRQAVQKLEGSIANPFLYILTVMSNYCKKRNLDTRDYWAAFYKRCEELGVSPVGLEIDPDYVHPQKKQVKQVISKQEAKPDIQDLYEQLIKADTALKSPQAVPALTNYFKLCRNNIAKTILEQDPTAQIELLVIENAQNPTTQKGEQSTVIPVAAHLPLGDLVYNHQESIKNDIIAMIKELDDEDYAAE